MLLDNVAALVARVGCVVCVAAESEEAVVSRLFGFGAGAAAVDWVRHTEGIRSAGPPDSLAHSRVGLGGKGRNGSTHESIGTDGLSPSGFRGLSFGLAASEPVSGLPVSGCSETGPVAGGGGGEDVGAALLLNGHISLDVYRQREKRELSPPLPSDSRSVPRQPHHSTLAANDSDSRRTRTAGAPGYRL